MDYSTPGFPVLHVSRNLLKLTSIELMMPSKDLILCLPLLLLPSIDHTSGSSIHCQQGGLSWSPPCKTNAQAVMAHHTHGTPLFPGHRFLLTENCYECVHGHVHTGCQQPVSLTFAFNPQREKKAQRECFISQNKKILIQQSWKKSTHPLRDFLKLHSGYVKSLIIFQICWWNSLNILFKVIINSLQRALI